MFLSIRSIIKYNNSKETTLYDRLPINICNIYLDDDDFQVFLNEQISRERIMGVILIILGAILLVI